MVERDHRDGYERQFTILLDTTVDTRVTLKHSKEIRVQWNVSRKGNVLFYDCVVAFQWSPTEAPIDQSSNLPCESLNCKTSGKSEGGGGNGISTFSKKEEIYCRPSEKDFFLGGEDWNYGRDALCFSNEEWL